MTIIERFIEALRTASQVGASDVHVAAGSPVRLRIRGQLVAHGDEPLMPPDTMAIALEILRQAGRIPAGGSEEYERTVRDEDCAFSVPGLSRFRANVCRQRGSAAIVLRTIANTIPTPEDLNLPAVVKQIALEPRGLVLVTGATGSGKSSTLASMIGLINRERPCKIVTIEDPIEFVYRDACASILQREVGNDTDSFARAMRAAMRQDPDVILVGEMRDRETIDIALKAAETGHLVLSTLHTPDAPRTIGRMLSYFAEGEQTMIRIRLSDSLRAVVSQRLLPRAGGEGRVPAVEVMRATPTIRDCVLIAEKTPSIPDYIRAGRDQYQMQSFDQHLMALYEAGLISREVGLEAATSPAEFERSLIYT